MMFSVRLIFQPREARQTEKRSPLFTTATVLQKQRVLNNEWISMTAKNGKRKQREAEKQLTRLPKENSVYSKYQRIGLSAAAIWTDCCWYSCCSTSTTTRESVCVFAQLTTRPPPKWPYISAVHAQHCTSQIDQGTKHKDTHRQRRTDWQIGRQTTKQLQLFESSSSSPLGTCCRHEIETNVERALAMKM